MRIYTHPDNVKLLEKHLEKQNKQDLTRGFNGLGLDDFYQIKPWGFHIIPTYWMDKEKKTGKHFWTNKIP